MNKPLIAFLGAIALHGGFELNVGHAAGVADHPLVAPFQVPIVRAEPNGARAILLSPPTFRWVETGIPPYQIEVVSQETKAVAARGTASDTFWRPELPLPTGAYEWSVADSQGRSIARERFAVQPGHVDWAISSLAAAVREIPAGHPRIWIRPEELPALKAAAATKQGRTMIAKWRAEVEDDLGAALPNETTFIRQVPTKAGERGLTSEGAAKAFAMELTDPIRRLSDLYLITGEPQFAAEIKRRALAAAKLDPEGFTAGSRADFAASYLANGLGIAYDTLFQELSSEDRASLRKAIGARIRTAARQYIPNQEQMWFGAHAWQMAIQEYAGAALATYEELPESREFFAWSLRAHIALYPWFGGNDGGSAEGMMYYLGTNLRQSLMAEALYRSATKISLFGNPWYRNTGYFLLYGWGLGGGRSQFGDISAQGNPLDARAKTSITLLAKQFQDPVLAAFAARIADRNDDGQAGFLQFKALLQPLPAATDLSTLPNARSFPQAGLVFLRSDLMHPANEVFFEFRSSPYGSYNHAHSDQNTFNVNAYGERLILDSGYYHKFNDDHHRLWTRTTKAHNGILIGGREEGPRTVDAHGEIVKFDTSSASTYFIGDARAAYLDAAVKRADRHVLWLPPATYIIADDVATAAPEKDIWMLHSLAAMTVNDARREVGLKVGEAEGHLRFYSPAGLAFSQTHEFTVPVHAWRTDTKNASYPDQWHLRVNSLEPAAVRRYVAVLQVCRAGQADRLPKVQIEMTDGGVKIELSDGKTGQINWRPVGTGS